MQSSDRWFLSGLLVGGLLIVSLAGSIDAGLFGKEETPGERFRQAMEKIKKSCESRNLAPGEVCGEVTNLKPADPLATEEGRFAHSIKIPNPVSADSGYKPGMTPEQYFDHLCKTEAGEFIYRTVDNVEGIYMMRPRKEATDYMQEHLYGMEDPYGYTDAEAVSPEFGYVSPTAYRYFETSVWFGSRPIRGKQFRHSSIEIRPNASAKYSRFYDYDGRREKTMKKEYESTRTSRYGYIWRGIARSHDRELGVAGGELIVLDLEKDEVLAVKRGFIRSGGSDVKNLTGIWWLRGQICSGDIDRAKLFPSFEFIRKVLRPKNASKEDTSHATK